ncbi:MAG: PfkB family carbohydrate kinase [Roseiarcus sp.]|uniref:ribokinase n=1 Tax=Roseiarcus sp. TaxID=1969460 RepID=UPI003C496968
MSKRPRIGVVGSSNVDLVTYVDRMPVWGETIAAPRFEMSHGGKGANQAVAAAKLGVAVVMVSKVGDDMLGDGVLQNFERTGVDARHVERANGQSTGTATILVDKSGDNCILIVKGANGDLTPEDVERAGDDLKTCDLILTQLEVPLETVYATLAFGKRHGVKTVLNPAPAVRDLDMERARDASFLMPNETELAILTRLPVESEAEVAAAAHSLVGRGFEAVIVTLGARGALIATPEGARRIAPVSRRSTPPAPATLSSAASPATSLPAFPSMRRSPKRAATPPSRSPGAGRRRPMRPRPSSKRSAPSSGERTRRRSRSPSPARGRGLG